MKAWNFDAQFTKSDRTGFYHFILMYVAPVAPG